VADELSLQACLKLVGQGRSDWARTKGKMRRAACTGFLLPLLCAACQTNVRDTKLSEINFADMALVQAISRELTTRERAALATYVVRHRAASGSFCGRRLLSPSGQEPTTLGEAIKLTLIRQDEELSLPPRPAAAAASGHAIRWKQLTDTRDMIIDRQGILTTLHGRKALRLPEWHRLESRLQQVNASMVEFRRQLAL
jgi:hypothetical protein